MQQNKRLSFVESLLSISQRLDNPDLVDDQEIRPLIVELAGVTYKIHQDYSILKEVEKLINKITSFQKGTLSKEVLVHKITSLAERILVSETNCDYMSCRRIALINTIMSMSDKEVDEIFGTLDS